MEITRTPRCPAIRAGTAGNNDRFVYPTVFLDGEAPDRPERFRLASADCFGPFVRTPAEAGAPPEALAATDGYRMILSPLLPSPHRLKLRAFCSGLGDMVETIARDLVVQAEQRP